jgi:hypothetical protein
MSLKMSLTKNTRSAKLSRLGAAMAINAARMKGDSDALRAKKFKDLWMKYKAKVAKKYGAKGKMMALKAASASGKSSFLPIKKKKGK